ncbi:hypothetical protein HUJ05_012692 [Dendroctonus ponderosae]|nr:hypothetical protein HUJ05_012692 [Dendroctonus ponderosae]
MVVASTEHPPNPIFIGCSTESSPISHSDRHNYKVVSETMVETVLSSEITRSQHEEVKIAHENAPHIPLKSGYAEICDCLVVVRIDWLLLFYSSIHISIWKSPELNELFMYKWCAATVIEDMLIVKGEGLKCPRVSGSHIDLYPLNLWRRKHKLASKEEKKF